ncbi:MAG: secretin N-terminal domain-containing protein [Pirellulaceae bacterium]
MSAFASKITLSLPHRLALPVCCALGVAGLLGWIGAGGRSDGWVYAQEGGKSGPSARAEATSPSAPPAASSRPTQDIDKLLARKGTLIVKEATLADWMFSIMQTWKVDIHFDPAALQRETYSAQFTDTPLSEVLNTILTPKGFAYQRVANGLSIVPLDSFPGKKPNQVTAFIRLRYSDPAEIEPTLKILMTPYGDTKIIASSKTLVVIDMPENVQQVREHVESLEQLAREAAEQKAADEKRQQEAAESQARAAQSAMAAINSAIGSTSLVDQTVTSVFALRFAAAGDVLEAVQNLVVDGQVTAIAQDNLLVVSGPDAAVRSAAQLIRQIDIPRKQVRISAVLYDVDLDALERLGVNWRNAGKGRIDGNNSPNSRFDL